MKSSSCLPAPVPGIGRQPRLGSAGGSAAWSQFTEQPSCSTQLQRFFFFVHLEAVTAFPAGFRSRRGTSEAAELDCKGAEAAKVSAALPSTMDCSRSQHRPMKRFTLINQHSVMLRCSFRKDVFLQKTLRLMEGFRKAAVQRGNSWPY